ncbi:MAG TPA: permease-like cell division protein FtsX [Anaeromyxobacteraceae bacterium]|nr:permease-like cell division protein FtsX [Anaeromyxobacteraceae bacterium]
MIRPTYFLGRAVDAIARAPRVAAISVATIFVAAFVTGLFAAVLHGAGKLLDAWAGEVRISVYLDPSANLEAARAVAARLAGGRDVEAVSSEEALRRFRAALREQGALLDGLGTGVLPPSVEVSVPGIGLAEARTLAKRLEAVPGAREVDFGNAWLEQLERLLVRLRLVGSLLLAVLATGAAVLVANTLRLGVFARRDEIEIMKLVGATDFFVEVPFLIEGLIQGLGAGVLAAGFLAAAAAVGLSRLSRALGTLPLAGTDLVPPALLLSLIAGGGLLGLVASALAVRGELRKP